MALAIGVESSSCTALSSFAPSDTSAATVVSRSMSRPLPVCRAGSFRSWLFAIAHRVVVEADRVLPAVGGVERAALEEHFDDLGRVTEDDGRAEQDHHPGQTEVPFDPPAWSPERRDWLKRVLRLVLPRVKRLPDFVDQARPFLTTTVDYDPEAVRKHLTTAGLDQHIETLVIALEADAETFEEPAIERVLRAVAP